MIILMKTKILFIASEFAPGMIPFASTIITTLNRDERFDVYALVVNSGNKSYAVTLGDMSKEHLLTGDFALSLYLSFRKLKDNWYYTVHDLHPHEVNSRKLTDVLFHHQ